MKLKTNFDTSSISVFGYPIKGNQANFFVALSRRYIIFGHFSSLFVIFRPFRGFSYLFYLIIGRNT